MQRLRRVICLVMIICLVGCGMGHKDIVTEEQTEKIATLGHELNYDYEVPIQSPELIVDRVGYYPGDKKIVYLFNSCSDQSFAIVNVENDEVEYQGIFNRVDLENGEFGFYLGDYSDFLKEGRYRVFQSEYGYSEEFAIDSNIYDSSLISICSELKTYNFTDNSELAYVLSNLLLTYEVYGEIYPDSQFIKAKIKLLLTQQQEKTGAVYEKILSSDEILSQESDENNQGILQVGAGISLSATAEFAGVMAKFYSDFKEEDIELAGECLNASIKAFDYVDKYRDNVSSDAYYFAASELYRATGLYKCRMAIALYDSLDESSKTFTEENYTILADIAYLMSEYGTDYKRCESIMNRYFDDVLEISSKTDRQHYYVQANIEELGMDEILDNMMKLGLVSYVISGREYASIQSNYLHYLMGANPENSNYFIDSRGNEEPIINNITFVTKILFAMKRSN